MAEKRNEDRTPVNANASGGTYTVDPDVFRKQLQALYTHWQQHKDELWGSADVIVVATQPSSKGLPFRKSSALSIWLLGCELRDAIMVFKDKQVHFMCSQELVSSLEVLVGPAYESLGIEFLRHVTENDVLSSQIDFMIHSISSPVVNPTVGYIDGEAPNGEFLRMWNDKLKKSSLLLRDITNGLSDLFAVPTDVGMDSIVEGSYCIAGVMDKYVVPKLEKVIDEKEKVTYASLIDYTTENLLDYALTSGESDNISMCYPPEFHSSGKFSSKTNDKFLYYGSPNVIMCAISLRCDGYCCNLARTYLIDPNAQLIEAYNVLYKAHEVAIHALRPGRKIKSVYEAACAVVKKNAPQLVPNLVTSAGEGIGLEFKDSWLDINAKNDRLIKVGMFFNVCLGFHNLKVKISKVNTSKPKNRKFQMMLADTVFVGSSRNTRNTRNTITTFASRKDLASATFSFREVEPEVIVDSKEKDEVAEMMKEESRKKHQKELARLKKKEIATRRCQRITTITTNEVITQEKLLCSANPIKLRELYIRTSFEKLGLMGTLNAHKNGFRYSAKRENQHVDIIYKNIKHAFFQPAEKEVITLVHFHLHDAIMVGNKQTTSVQFYVETVKMLDCVRKVSIYDPDETVIGSSRKDVVNTSFQDFVNKVDSLWRQPQFEDLKLKFEQPLRNLGFFGMPSKYKSFVFPTSSCLVELLDNDFFVITLDEVDILSLERVTEHNNLSKTFDLGIIFKDFGRAVKMIRQIPFSSLNGIKEWIDDKDIVYYESSKNLRWDLILSSIRSNLQVFINDGGWKFLKDQDILDTFGF